MKNRSICKFVNNFASDKIEILKFICETDPDTMRSKQKLNHNRAILVKQGEGKFEIDGVEIAFNTGSLLFGFEGETLAVLPDKDCEYLYIDFGGNRAESLFRRFLINKTSRIFSGFDGLIPLWYDSLYRASEESIDLAAESVLLYSFSRLTVDHSTQNGIVGNILELTEENFTDSHLSIGWLAETLSYNEKYISHVFKEKMNISYSEYLRTLRIKYAVSLLEQGIDSVKNVAFLSGFNDPLYFSTVFKNTVGLSPTEYKKNLQRRK